MNKLRSSWLICATIIVMTATFTIGAYALPNPGTNVPPAAGFSSPGPFPQGGPAGTFGQAPAGGIAVGEPAPSGGQTCQCIRAPCVCPGPPPIGTPVPPGQVALNQPLQYQPVVNRPPPTLPAQAGPMGNVGPGRVAGTGARY